MRYTACGNSNALLTYVSAVAAAVCCAQIIGALPALQNAFLRYTGLDGPLSCGLVANPTLTRLSISGNNVTGTLPPCMLQVGQQLAGSRVVWLLWSWWRRMLNLTISISISISSSSSSNISSSCRHACCRWDTSRGCCRFAVVAALFEMYPSSQE
jgi:hypothetical protein